MDEIVMKICPNCKREIPSVNFTIHSVHCARNIKVCPVCKEPVPQNDLQEHQDKYHKLMPCKHCGESVCGTDMEDHIRDSCGHTIKSCRYCELELPRHDLPTHESYCGVRTEQCKDCKEWIMIKYRQVHVDTNHGFIRLDDDPLPQSKKVKPDTTNIRPISDVQASTSNGVRSDNDSRTKASSPRANETSRDNTNSYRTGEIIGGRSGINGSGDGKHSRRIRRAEYGNSSREAEGNGATAGTSTAYNTSDQPQRKVTIPPLCIYERNNHAPAHPVQDSSNLLALTPQQLRYSGRQRLGTSSAAGISPGFSPVAKPRMLNSMDSQNRETEDSRDCTNDRSWGHWMNVNDSEWAGRRLGRAGTADLRNDLGNLEPMSGGEFMARFNQLQLGGPPATKADRFSEIKTSLRELRRGLNEVTAPYNSCVTNNPRSVWCSGSDSSSGSPQAEELPCEFCGAPVPAEHLVQHQTGCRPDLCRPGSPPPPPGAPPRSGEPPEEIPMIPCEFCTSSLPVYLITAHQERCRKNPNLRNQASDSEW